MRTPGSLAAASMICANVVFDCSISWDEDMAAAYRRAPTRAVASDRRAVSKVGLIVRKSERWGRTGGPRSVGLVGSRPEDREGLTANHL